MKIRILKENKKRQEQLDEALRDYVLGGALALGSMFGGSKTAKAGVEGYSADTVELATAFAKEGIKNSKDVDKSIIYSKALEDLQIANKTPETEKKESLNQEAQGLLRTIDNFLKNANQKDLEWAKKLVQKNKSIEIKD
jgi:hypothetical protein